MSSYARIAVIDGFVDAVADMVCNENLNSIHEVGVFQHLAPAPELRTVAAAIRNDEGHLGLAQWSLNSLYVEGKKRLLADASDFRAASAMLLASSDYSSAWNTRKRCLLPDQVTDELRFNWLILTRSPKSAETWSHRSWVLRKFGFTSPCAQNELELAWIAASRAPNNYYAGVHRLRVVGKAPSECLLTELERSRKWLKTHVSDSSGWWYHRQLIGLLKTLGIASIATEVAYSSELFERYRESHQNVLIQWKWVSELQKATDRIAP